MTTAYTSLLGLALPVTGELSGTWGDVVNNSITSLLDSAVAGTTNVSTDGDVTLTTTTGAANTAREAILLFSGARTALRTVTAPAQSKTYTVINATTGGYSVKLVGVGPTTGLTIPNGASAVVAWNGSDFVEIGAGSIGNLVVNGTLTVTGATTLQSTLAVTGNITNTAGTANGVTYLNGSKVLTSGSALTFDGNALEVSTSGSTRLNLVSSSTSAGAGAGIFMSNAAVIGRSGRWLGDTSNNLLIASRTTSSVVGDIVFGLGDSYTEQMRLTSAGLGIGTSSPDAKLRIQSDNTSGTAFKIRDGGTPTGNLVDISSSTYGQSLLLTGTGNLGLGVTPSAWDSGFKVIQLGGGAYLGQYNANAVQVGLNTYFNGTNYIYTTTNEASRFVQSDGQFQWFTAPSGTAGNAITFTQAMTLDASGNLLVGNTGGTGYRLNVVAAFASGLGGAYIEAGEYDKSSLIINHTNASVSVPLFQVQKSGTGVLTLDSSGNLLVGTTDSSLTTGNGLKLLNSATGKNLVLNSSASTNGNEGFMMYSTGAGAYRFYVQWDGKINATSTTIAAISDERLKENIRDLDFGLADILALKPRRYDWKEGKGVNIKNAVGFIAQEFETVFPASVGTTKAGEDGIEYKNICHEELIPTLVKAIQELKAEFDAYKASHP